MARRAVCSQTSVSSLLFRQGSLTRPFLASTRHYMAETAASSSLGQFHAFLPPLINEPSSKGPTDLTMELDSVMRKRKKKMKKHKLKKRRKREKAEKRKQSQGK